MSNICFGIDPNNNRDYPYSAVGLDATVKIVTKLKVVI